MHLVTGAKVGALLIMLGRLTTNGKTREHRVSYRIRAMEIVE